MIFECEPLVLDAGTSFIVETSYYKVRLSKEKPKVIYIGDNIHNYLGEGEEHLFLSIYDFKKDYFYILDELKYDRVTLGNNIVIYEAVLKDNENESKPIVKIRVIYEFYKYAFKRTIEIYNSYSSGLINIDEFSDDLTLLADYFEFGGVKKLIRRTIYPNQDYSLIKDKKFKWIYINGSGNNGMYIEYEPTTQLPAKVLYKGLIGYKGYALVRIYLSHEKVYPGESIRIVQWFSLGELKEAKENVERCKFISIYLYPDGKLPLIVIGQTDEIDDKWLEGFKLLKNLGIKEYILAIMNNDVKLPSSMDLKVITIPTYHSEGFTNSTNFNGVYVNDVPDEYTFNVLNNLNVKYIFGKVVPAPFEYLYEEGYRIPKILRIEDKQTNMVLLPISSPVLDERHRTINEEKLFRVITVASDNDDILVFKWNADLINMGSNYVIIKRALNYAKMEGYEFVSPEKIAEHIKKLQNVTLKVHSEEKKIVILVQNKGKEEINGLTLRVKLKDKPSAVFGGEIVRSVEKGDKTVIYVSTDVPALGSKAVIIRL